MLKRTVLVVDDKQINRKILGRLLQNEYEILYAADGIEALESLRSHADVISAVLLDIVMPKMDGYGVLTAMSEDPQLSKIPVIVSSQKDGDEAEIKALSLGAQDFIAKPYKGDIIRHRLENTIRLRETAAMINKAEKDEQTGLYNKQFFFEKVREEISKNPDKQYDLLCFGIERYKLITDTFGSSRGEDLLRYAAGILQEASKEINICGRLSADQFCTLFPHQDIYSEERFRGWMDRVNEFPIDMDISTYCGIYEISDDGISVSAMCDRAQLAAEENKGRYGAGFSYYDDSIRQKLMEEQFIISTMQTALEQKQFEVYYQPKYDLNSELIAGAEALVRWNHPERGFLSPGAFIPLFESNGFITQLDKYVWETVCRDLHDWMEQGHQPVAVSINVSRADIYNPKLADILLEFIARYKVPIEYLHLEITESAYTDNSEQIITVVNRLRDLGFIIEMDDFGSGYSSLNMLAEMPVDILKLDMKFIQNQAVSSGKGILSFVISLAKWLNLAVVAEGVETGEQIASLRSMDCNYVQGFYYARPMKLTDFQELLLQSQTTQMNCTGKTAAEYVEEKQQNQNLAEGKQMLVVDDIEVNRAVLTGTFFEEFVVVEKEDGKQAWEYLQENCDKVAVVMLDLLMPVMDGFQLLGRIRSDERMQDIPVIITSQGDADSEQRALDMRADDFISKPYRPDIIRHRVHNVLASYTLNHMQEQEGEAIEYNGESSKIENRTFSTREQLQVYMNGIRPHFDAVRLVDPQKTMVCESGDTVNCDSHSCYSLWEKSSRCSNCVSLRALERHGRCNKLEYSDDGLFFVISEYVHYENQDAVIEMVTKLEDEYVDNVFDKNLLYMSLDNINKQLESDELTGVYNRRHIDRYLDSYIESSKNRRKDMGIAMIDIDSFKELNDTYGHLTGDEALKEVAKIMERNIARSKGDFVARFGGDEFIIVCRDIAPETFQRRITSVATLIKYITTDDGTKIDAGISAGCVSLSEFPEATSKELIEHADRRLYKAKHSGRDRVVTTDEGGEDDE